MFVLWLILASRSRHGKNVVEGAVVSLADFREQLAELTGREDWVSKPSNVAIVLQVHLPVVLTASRCKEPP